MAEVNIWTVDPLPKDVIAQIEARYNGEEVLLDSDDFDEDLDRYSNYFFGHDKEGEDGDISEEIFPRETAQEACQWLDDTFPEVVKKVSVTPYHPKDKY